MIDGGVMIAAGTDAGNIGTSHAASYLTELLAMKDCGLTNWQVIQSATINPAYILDQQDHLGSIQTGKQADLVLLDANPVVDLENLKKITLVINKGKTLVPATLLEPSTEDLVQAQVAAYNARNLEAFMETYADDIEFYEFPDSLMGKGKEHMRKQYEAMFKHYPNLHVEIMNRMVQGNMVIDQERVTGVGPQPLTAIAIYEVQSGKISKVHFVFKNESDGK